MLSGDTSTPQLEIALTGELVHSSCQWISCSVILCKATWCWDDLNSVGGSFLFTDLFIYFPFRPLREMEPILKLPVRLFFFICVISITWLVSSRVVCPKRRTQNYTANPTQNPHASQNWQLLSCPQLELETSSPVLPTVSAFSLCDGLQELGTAPVNTSSHIWMRLYFSECFPLDLTHVSQAFAPGPGDGGGCAQKPDTPSLLQLTFRITDKKVNIAATWNVQR